MFEDENLKSKIKKMKYHEMNNEEKHYYNLYIRPLSVPKDSMERLYKALLND